MPYSTRAQAARYKRLRARQPSTGWSGSYEAGIRATRSEAPASSRPTRISRLNRIGRTLHALSRPERTAILLALYCPSVFALREQFVLCPAQSPHPFLGHPRFAGIELPPLPGTVSVFDAMGELDRHPIVRIREKGEPLIELPDLFVADLILGLSDSEGPYCLHWTVKASVDGFETPFAEALPVKNPQLQRQRFDLRMRMDRLYFGAAGIPTHNFAGDEISRKVVKNLESCFSWEIRKPLTSSSASVEALICSTDLAATTPHHLLLYCRNRFEIDEQTFKCILYGLVWRRVLRVDLFQTLLFDHPWPPEQRDVLSVYEALFARAR